MDQMPDETGQQAAWHPLQILHHHGNEQVAERDESPSAYLVFTLAGQDLAVNIASVREILDTQTVTPLPKAPPRIEGMIDVRDRGIAVLDLASCLGLHGYMGENQGRFVVFEFDTGDGAKLPIAVRTEDVRDVTEIPADSIEPAPQTLDTWDSAAIEGVARRDDTMVVVLDLHAVCAPQGVDASLFDFS